MRSKEAVILFGKSGVGKSTYTELLVRDDSNYYAPKVIAARPPRHDDSPNRYEYVTLRQFRRMVNQRELAYYAEDGIRGYGIHHDSLASDPRTAVITCGSPYNIETPLMSGWINVLVIGDAQRGLAMRETDLEFIRQRRKINQELAKRFYSQLSFLRCMHIIFRNDFNLSPEEQASLLHNCVVRRLSHAKQKGGPYFVNTYIETDFYKEDQEHVQSYHLFPIQQ